MIDKQGLLDDLTALTNNIDNIRGVVSSNGGTLTSIELIQLNDMRDGRGFRFGTIYANVEHDDYILFRFLLKGTDVELQGFESKIVDKTGKTIIRFDDKHNFVDRYSLGRESIVRESDGQVYNISKRSEVEPNSNISDVVNKFDQVRIWAEKLDRDSAYLVFKIGTGYDEIERYVTNTLGDTK